FAPAACSVRAVALPSPWPPPVMTAVRDSRAVRENRLPGLTGRAVVEGAAGRAVSEGDLGRRRAGLSQQTVSAAVRSLGPLCQDPRGKSRLPAGRRPQ